MSREQQNKRVTAALRNKYSFYHLLDGCFRSSSVSHFPTMLVILLLFSTIIIMTYSSELANCMMLVMPHSHMEVKFKSHIGICSVLSDNKLMPTHLSWEDLARVGKVMSEYHRTWPTFPALCGIFHL